jgi:hypothetical protein
MKQVLIFLWNARITIYGYVQVVLGVLAASDGLFAPRTLKLIILGNGILTACLGHYSDLKRRQASNVAPVTP